MTSSPQFLCSDKAVQRTETELIIFSSLIDPIDPILTITIDVSFFSKSRSLSQFLRHSAKQNPFSRDQSAHCTSMYTPQSSNILINGHKQ